MIKKKKNIFLFVFLSFIFLSVFSRKVFAQNPNTFSCTWQPETNQCAENLTLNTCQNGFESNPQVCTSITSDSTCYNTVDQPCVSSDLPQSRWKCVQGNCYPCIENESCPYENPTTCNQACTPPTSTPIPPPQPGGGGSNEEGIDFGILSGAIPSLRTAFQPGPTSNVSEIISAVLPYLFVIAGLLLLFYLIYGGFHMMTAANDEKGLAEAKGKITNALVGFLLLFVSYWLVQILGHILGINIF